MLPPHLPPLLCLLCHRAHENIFIVWSWFVFFSLLDSTKRVPTIIPMHSAAELRVPCISSGEGSRARTRTPLNRLFFSARGRFPFPFQILLFLREKLATPPTPPPKKKPCAAQQNCAGSSRCLPNQDAHPLLGLPAVYCGDFVLTMSEMVVFLFFWGGGISLTVSLLNTHGRAHTHTRKLQRCSFLNGWVVREWLRQHFGLRGVNLHS